jgi:hypothetical protein
MHLRLNQVNQSSFLFSSFIELEVPTFFTSIFFIFLSVTKRLVFFDFVFWSCFSASYSSLFVFIFLVKKIWRVLVLLDDAVDVKWKGCRGA